MPEPLLAVSGGLVSAYKALVLSSPLISCILELSCSSQSGSSTLLTPSKILPMTEKVIILIGIDLKTIIFLKAGDSGCESENTFHEGPGLYFPLFTDKC